MQIAYVFSMLECKDCTIRKWHKDVSTHNLTIMLTKIVELILIIKVDPSKPIP